MKPLPPKAPSMRTYKSSSRRLSLIAFIAFVLAFGIGIGMHIH